MCIKNFRICLLTAKKSQISSLFPFPFYLQSCLNSYFFTGIIEVSFYGSYQYQSLCFGCATYRHFRKEIFIVLPKSSKNVKLHQFLSNKVQRIPEKKRNKILFLLTAENPRSRVTSDVTYLVMIT